MTNTEETIKTRRDRQQDIHALLDVLDGEGIAYGQVAYTQDRERGASDTVRDQIAGSVERFDILTPVDVTFNTFYAGSGDEEIERVTSQLVRFLFDGREHVNLNGSGNSKSVRFFGVHSGLAIKIVPGGGAFVGEVVTGEKVVPVVERSYKGLTNA